MSEPERAGLSLPEAAAMVGPGGVVSRNGIRFTVSPDLAKIRLGDSGSFLPVSDYLQDNWTAASSRAGDDRGEKPREVEGEPLGEDDAEAFARKLGLS